MLSGVLWEKLNERGHATLEFIIQHFIALLYRKSIRNILSQ